MAGHGSGAQGAQDRGGRLELGLEGHALPRHEAAADDQERERELHKFRETRDGPDDHALPKPAVALVARHLLRAGRRHAHSLREIERTHGRVEKARLLGDGFDEEQPRVWIRDRDGDAWQAAAAAEINQFGQALRTEQRHGGQAVEEVEASDVDRLADGGQVDGRGPAEQQPNVAVELRERRCRQCQPEGVEPS